MWWRVAWRPTERPSWESFTRMFRFGAGSLGSGLLSTGFDNLYAVITGRLFGTLDLGLLTRANQLQQLPVNTATSIMLRITFPLLAREQENAEGFLRRLRQCIRHTATWHFPMMLGLAAVAPALIVTLYSAKWEGSVPYLQILAFAGLFYPVSAILVNSILANGRSGFVLFLDLLKKPFLLIFLWTAAPHGPLAIAMAMTAYTFACFVINMVAVAKTTPYLPLEMLRDLWPALFAATISASVAFGFGLYGATHLYQWLNLAVQVMLGGTVYLFVIFLGRRGVYSEIWGLLSYACAKIRGVLSPAIPAEER
jgi:O-antigen/teichoic acid export membrane protein